MLCPAVLKMEGGMGGVEVLLECGGIRGTNNPSLRLR